MEAFSSLTWNFIDIFIVVVLFLGRFIFENTYSK